MLDFKYPPENMLNENMKFILISLTHMKKNVLWMEEGKWKKPLLELLSFYEGEKFQREGMKSKIQQKLALNEGPCDM